MNPRTRIILAVLVAAAVVGLPGTATAQEKVRVMQAAPVYFAPYAIGTPLMIATEGTIFVALRVGEEWVTVEWQDETRGRTTGYVQAKFVKRTRDLVDTPTIPPPAEPPPLLKPVPPPAAPAKPQAPTPKAPTQPAATPTKPQAPPPKAATPPAAAKKLPSTARRWSDRAIFGVNGIYQGGSRVFSESRSFDLYVETGRDTATYPKLDGAAFDAGGGIRLVRNLAVGAAVSYFKKSGTASVESTIPHPFHFNQARLISGSVSPINRTELAVHIQAAWVIPAGKKVLVTLAGGPSYFNVRHSRVTTLWFNHSYPYDTAEFLRADVEEVSKSVLGFNAGVDVGYYFSKAIGVGGFVRYATAEPILGGGWGDLKVRVGGFQAGGGLRIRIPPGPPKAPSKSPTPAPKAPPMTAIKSPEVNTESARSPVSAKLVISRDRESAVYGLSFDSVFPAVSRVAGTLGAVTSSKDQPGILTVVVASRVPPPTLSIRVTKQADSETRVQVTAQGFRPVLGEDRKAIDNFFSALTAELKKVG